MAPVINKPTQIKAAGNKTKIIQEFIGRINSKTDAVSIAVMTSPQGWEEPGQKPEFDEYTLVLEGSVHVKTKKQEYDIPAGGCFIAQKGEWVKYSTPGKDGAKYVAVCLPAFSPNTVHREAS